MADVQPSDPEYGVHCPDCGAQVVMVNVHVIECPNPNCDRGQIPVRAAR